MTLDKFKSHPVFKHSRAVESRLTDKLAYMSENQIYSECLMLHAVSSNPEFKSLLSDYIEKSKSGEFV